MKAVLQGNKSPKSCFKGMPHDFYNSLHNHVLRIQGNKVAIKLEKKTSKNMVD